MKLPKLASCFVPVMLGLSPAPAFAADIWLSGEDPAAQVNKHLNEPADYMDMFKPGAPWSKAASGLAVFKVGTRFVLQGDEAQLQTVINDLKRRHIAFAIELAVIGSEGVGHCGYGVEGYGSPAGVEAVARKIQKLGGEIDYVAMDEPVWYGHIFEQGSGGRVGCQYSVAELADRVAPKVALLRQYFPHIQIGDIEPVNARKGGQQSIEDIVRFETLLRQKTGFAPAFVHVDMSWEIPGWQPLMERLVTQVHAGGLRLGLICDGSRDAGGDEAWVSQAVQRCQSVAADPKTRPDDFIVQSWQPLPTKMLPETDPGALTYAARQVEASFH